MTVGIIKDDLIVRVKPELMSKELEKPHVEPLAFTGKPMKEFIQVSQDGIQSESQLLEYLVHGLDHAKRKADC